MRREYPMTLEEFENRFNTEEACRDYLFLLRWPNGFICPKCGNTKAWAIRTVLFECSKCHYQTSVIAGTIFQDTRKPLTMWFRAIWWVTSQKNGTSALGLQRILGLKSYQTAWTWLHKLRTAMLRPGRDKLSGYVEVDETYLVSGDNRKQGRGAEEKSLIAVAVEIKDKLVGRIRLSQINDASSDSLHSFTIESIERGSTIHTDGWSGYSGIESLGYTHTITKIKGRKVSDLLPHVHIVVSLLKRWILGTHQGSVSKKYISYYLDEFTFRFNRRTSSYRGKLFYRLLENAVLIGPTTYEDFVNSGNLQER
jgi:transposase-like protein